MQRSAIFPLFFLPPISYFSAIQTLQQPLVFEKFENFPKQTYRNRATVLSPNGPLDLIVPVIKGSRLSGSQSGCHTRLTDVRICYDSDWQRLHWKSLESCYRSSAYFEYYESELEQIYKTRFTYLYELNEALLKWIFNKLKMNIEMRFTEEYAIIDSKIDYRNQFHKKRESENFKAKIYFQVFDDRCGFQPDLSIVDLLFNQGPQASKYF